MATTPKAIIAIGVKPDDAPEPAEDGINVPEPKGWAWPDGVDPKEGDSFMCKVKQGPDGMLTLVDIDGLPLKDEPPVPPEPPAKPMSAMDVFAKGKQDALAAA